MELRKAALDVVLVTRDLDAMVAFYRDQLGFPVQGEVDIPSVCKVVRMACGESLIRLCRPYDDAQAPAATGPMLAATGLRALSFSVGNLGDLVAKWEAAGVGFQTAYRQQRPGLTLAVIYDPDGNAIEVQCQE